jgi:translocator protein
MKINRFGKFIIMMVLPQLAGAIGSFFTLSSVTTWYVLLNKPTFNPPSSVFGPVWALLYVLMGISAFLVWQRGSPTENRKNALTLFFVQLILNPLWSVIFFGLRNLGGAFIEICVLWLAILLTTIWFFRVSKTAGYLMLPYIAWVTFAGYLTYSLWMLN